MVKFGVLSTNMPAAQRFLRLPMPKVEFRTVAKPDLTANTPKLLFVKSVFLTKAGRVPTEPSLTETTALWKPSNVDLDGFWHGR